VTLLVLADRKGSRQIDGWVRPLQAAFGDRIEIAGLADVRRVPALMRGLVRSSFKKGLDYPVMLDWDGDAVTRFDFRPNQANLFVIDPEGIIQLHVSGKSTAKRVKELETFVQGEIEEEARDSQ
jgi:hypothetical protein